MDGCSRALLLTGPTASGKTALATALAEQFPFEIISADSMQVYRGMEIGTAQPSADERARARFHLAGVWEPSDAFSARRWLDLCAQAHREIVARGRLPLYVGGTGMYLRALRWGLFEEGASDPLLRAQLEREVAETGPASLHARLAGLDPESARRIGPADAVRIVRALEVQALTGRPASELRRQWEAPRPRFPHTMVVLALARDELRRRIAARTGAMLAEGWIAETRRLLEGGLDPASHCFKALGYREIIEHLEGRLGRAALAERIALRTAQFARRQLVWLRRERPAIWLDLATPGGAARKLELMISILHQE